MRDAEPRTRRCALFASGVLIALAASTTLTFWPALAGEFLNWDDTVNYERNVGFRGATAASWAWCWRANTLGVYQPVSWMIIGAVNGPGEPSAARLHATALIVHALTAMLCTILFVQLLDATWPRRADESGRRRWLAAGAAAGAYALHPLRAETVAWASALPYELATVFAVACIVAYLRAVSCPARIQWTFYALAVLLAAAAMLSKSAAVALPAVLILIDAYPLRRYARAGGAARARLVAEKFPFLFLAAGTTIGAIWASASTELPADAGGATIGARAAQAAYGLAFAASRTIAPLGLSPYYPGPVSLNPLEARFLVAGAVVVLLTIAAIGWRRRIPGLTAAWAAYLLVLLPAVGVVSHGHQLTADRYATLSTIGLFAVLAAAFWRGVRSPCRGPLVAAALVALIALASLSARHSRRWADSVSLWSEVVRRFPDSHFAHKSLAGAYSDEGDPQRAEQELRLALKLHPDFGLAHYDLGVLLQDRGDLDGAIAAFRHACERVPTFSGAHYNLGVALAAAGRLDEAARAFTRAREIAPDDVATLNNLGAVLTLSGRTDEAVDVLLEAAALDSKSADVQFNLGNAFIAGGDPAEAVLAFDRALRIDPGHGDAAVNLALRAIDLGDWHRAITGLRRAHAASPDHDAAAVTLAWALVNAPDPTLRDPQTAVEVAQRVCRRTNFQDPRAVEVFEAAKRAGGISDEQAPP